LTDVVHVSTAEALDINTVNMLVLVAAIPASGALSDRVGRKPPLLAAALGLLLLSWPLLWLMHHMDAVLIGLGQLGFAVLVGLLAGANAVTMVEAFPTRVRCSALSVAYNLSLGLFGGTTPMVATYLIKRSHHDLSPAFYLMAAAAVSLMVVLRLRETAHEPLR
jgi:MHS family proline/betaine transporter-like MFS transporter